MSVLGNLGHPVISKEPAMTEAQELLDVGRRNESSTILHLYGDTVLKAISPGDEFPYQSTGFYNSHFKAPVFAGAVCIFYFGVTMTRDTNSIGAFTF
jgi:hypothetical protein